MPRYAAIDIGSNSIRMEAAEVVPGQPARILASDREVTRLGESVFRTGSVSEEAIRNTCVVLARMAGLYRKLDVVGVRAVATSAIRDSRNQFEFLARARNSNWLRLSRMALVATARTPTTSSLRYSPAMRASTTHVFLIASSLTDPVRKTLSPSRVTSRSEARIRAGCPGTTSAASIRMELLPISMAA